MIKTYIFKHHNNINTRISIISYMIISALSIFVAIMAMLIAINYSIKDGLNYNENLPLKIFNILSVSIFFAILSSFITFYLDKRKIKKLVDDFKHEYNKTIFDEGLHFMKDLDKKIIPDILKEIEKRRAHYGKLEGLDIVAVNIIVKGISMKKVEYSIPCISMYASGLSESITLNFYTVNNGDLKLKDIVYPVNSTLKCNKY